MYTVSWLIFLLFSSCQEAIAPKGTPTCLQQRIDNILERKVWSPPAQVYQFDYEGATVYYFTSRCCDLPSDLYDKDCNLICHPDGGFAGSGDGKCLDLPDREEWQLLWEDTRE